MMKTLSRASVLAASAAALLLLGTAQWTPSWAQTTPPQRAPNPNSASAPAAPALKPAPNPLTGEDVSKIKGTAVYGADDKKIGTITTILMQPSSKTIDRLVVGAGGVLGVGAHDVALPVDQFAWDAERGVFKVGMDLAAVKAMPEWGKPASATAASTTAPARPAAPAAPSSAPAKPAAPAN